MRSLGAQTGVFYHAGEPPAFLCESNRRRFLPHHVCVYGTFVNYVHHGVKKFMTLDHMYDENAVSNLMVERVVRIRNLVKV